MRAPTPHNEPERLAALLSCAILDTPSEAAFDDIARLAGQVCDTPIAVVSLVDAHRQWFKARVGISATEGPRDLSFCAHTINSPELLVVPDTREDERFADNPAVIADPSIRFYAGAPLLIEPDVAVGTLCVIDHVPRELTPVQLSALATLARQVASEIKLRRTLATMRPMGVHSEGAGAHRALDGRVVDGRYRIERVLGVGGMGIVVAAHDDEAGRPVAIKFLVSEAKDDPEAQERFVREAKAVLKVGGEHVAQVLDVGNLGNGAPYIVMERLEGEDLERRVERDGAIPAREAVGYVLQACTAIGRAHEAGIVHRDLKPANLFVTKRPDGSDLVKVLDFGVSKFSRASSLIDDPSLTSRTAVLGSPYYMCPEQMRGVTIDARADIWALGVILHELITRELPFEGRNFAELCASILTQPPRPLGGPEAGVPDGLEEVVDRCLAKDPAARYPTVAELVVALAPFADGAPAKVEPPAPAKVEAAVAEEAVPVVALPPRSSRWQSWFAAAGLLALLAVVVLIMAGTARVGR